MKYLLAVAFLGFVLSFARTLPRVKRQAYELPDGVELIVGPIKTTFSCQADGYYADVDNGCRIFHVCHSVPKEDGSQEILQSSFACGNTTIFNQFSLTCANEEEAVPCNVAPDFFYLNDKIGKEDVRIHEDQELERAQLLYPGYQARQ